MSAPLLTLPVPNLAALPAAAAQVRALLQGHTLVCFEGEMGAGKSALARALLRHLLGNPGLVVPSPTFTLVQTYDSPRGPVAHFDLWRLDGPGALLELGWDEARDGIVLVEWPDRLGALRPADALTLHLQHAGDDARTATLSGWEARSWEART